VIAAYGAHREVLALFEDLRPPLAFRSLSGETALSLLKPRCGLDICRVEAPLLLPVESGT